MWDKSKFLLVRIYLYCMKPKYKINETYFEKIDTEDKSYFLGLIFADGYLNEKRKYVSISLQDIDVDILQKLKLSIETNKPLQYIKRKEENTRNQYRLEITRKKITEDLLKLGVSQKKSLTASPSKLHNLPENIKKSFLRGYFDGDGSLTFYKVKNTLNSTVNICCTKEFYTYFSEFIQKIIKVNCTLSKRFKDDTNIYDLRICGNRNVKKFLEFLYENSTIFLDRKWLKYKEFINEYENLNHKLGDKVTVCVKCDNKQYEFKSLKSASQYFEIPLTTFKRNVKKIPNYLGCNWTIERM